MKVRTAYRAGHGGGQNQLGDIRHLTLTTDGVVTLSFGSQRKVRLSIYSSSPNKNRNWGHVDVAELLPAKGAQVNGSWGDETWLPSLATSHGLERLAEQVIADGADIDAKIIKAGRYRGKAAKGDTPLHCAARKHKDLAKIILANGADANAQDSDGDTLMHDTYATRSRSSDYSGEPCTLQYEEQEPPNTGR